MHALVLATYDFAQCAKLREIRAAISRTAHEEGGPKLREIRAEISRTLREIFLT